MRMSLDDVKEKIALGEGKKAFICQRLENLHTKKDIFFS